MCLWDDFHPFLTDEGSDEMDEMAIDSAHFDFWMTLIFRYSGSPMLWCSGTSIKVHRDGLGNTCSELHVVCGPYVSKGLSSLDCL